MTIEKPLVTIVTPSFNQAEYLPETLSSVASQQNDAFEIEHIVMDGGSTDGSVDLLHNSMGVTWRSEPDCGQSDAVNKGLRLSKGEIIGWINSDDYYLPNAFATVVQYFRDHPDATWLYGDCYFVNERNEIIGTYDTRPYDFLKLLNRGAYVPQQATFFRRKVLETIGYLDPSLHLSMDYDYWLRIGKQYPGVYIPTFLACFRRHSATKTDRQAARHWAESLEVSRAHGGHYLSTLYFRSLTQAVYRTLPPGIRKLSRSPLLAPVARRLR